LESALEEYTGQYDDIVARTVVEAASRVPAFALRLAEAGVSAAAVTGVGDLDKLPILSKDDLLRLQHAEPPFGGLVAEDAAVWRIFQSPGPLYEPQLVGADPWRWRSALQAAGFGRGDLVLNCFGYHLSPAGAMLEEAAAALGCVVVPAGVGNLDLQVRAIADLGVTAYLGLPSYLKALLDKFDELDYSESAWQVAHAVVTAEPLPDSLRALLVERVPTVRMAYGTAEAGLLGYEVSPGDGLRLPEGVLVQVCDLSTGEALTDEREGQVVVTLLRPEYPLVRFGTGDLSAWRLASGGELRLAGVLGRVGQAVKVRGMFLHPAQVQSALRDLPQVASYRLVVSRERHRDELRAEVVPSPGSDVAGVAAAVADRIKSALRFTAEVKVVDELAEEGVIVDQRVWD
jgi:phenylacetate-CoA ligase